MFLEKRIYLSFIYCSLAFSKSEFPFFTNIFHFFIHSCHKCQKFFLDLEKLQEHLYDHLMNSTQKKCTDSGKSSAPLSNTKKQTKATQEQHLFECYSCKNTFKLKSSLQTHMKMHVRGEISFIIL